MNVPVLVALVLVAAWCVGMFLRGFVGTLYRRWRDDPEFRDSVRLLAHWMRR